MMTHIDQLIKRRIALANQTDIPDMAVYALQWNALAAEFEAAAMQVNAALCLSKWRYYAALDAGHYTRVFDSSPIVLLAAER